MNESKSQTTEQQAPGFEKIWMEGLSKTMQAAFAFNPNSTPPEAARQARDAVLQALSESWEKFLRSPEFLEATKRCMEQAINFRKLSNDLMGQVRHEMQAPSREDIDTIMLAVRHLEQRLLDRMEALSAQINAKPDERGHRQRVPRHKAPKHKSRSPSRGRKAAV